MGVRIFQSNFLVIFILREKLSFCIYLIIFNFAYCKSLIIYTLFKKLNSCGNIKISTQKEHEIEEYLRKKYADDTVAARHFGDGGEEMSDEITQQTLLPGVK